MTPLLTQLHWLKVPVRIKFKLAVLVYIQVGLLPIHQTAPPYLAEAQYLLSRPASVSAPLRHHRLSSDAPVVQPSATEHFRSLLPDCGTAEHHDRAATDPFIKR